MRVFCSICKDVYLPSSDVQVTNCGHLYHTLCISTWLKQHRTCPQCRTKLSQPIKIYFDVEKDSDLDVNVLENRVEILTDKIFDLERNFKVVQGEKDCYVKIVQDIEEDNEKLRTKSKTMKLSIKTLKEQIAELKKQNESLTCLKREVTEWKNKITTLEKLETIIKGSADEVNKLLENTPVTELAVRHLCTYVGVLKVQLQKSEAKYIKLDKVMKTLVKSMSEEKKKNTVDLDLIENLKLKVSMLELQLNQTKTLFRDYRKKNPEKSDLKTSLKIIIESSGSKNDTIMESDENETAPTVQPAVSVTCDKRVRDLSVSLPNTKALVNKLDVVMDIDENEGTKATDFNKFINNWEEIVSAGPSTGLSHKSKLYSTISFSKSERHNSSTGVYAFDGLGGRKKLRLGGPTPQEEFEDLKRKKIQKTSSSSSTSTSSSSSSCQHKKIINFYQKIQ